MIGKIRLKALMKMHESCTVSTILTNCEEWLLNKGKREGFQKIELYSLKTILNVPVTTPNPANCYITGFLLTPLKIDKRQLNYLKTLTDQPAHDWNRRRLNVLRNPGSGGASEIDQKLEEFHRCTEPFL